MTIGRFLRSRLSLPKPNFAEFGQIAKVQYIRTPVSAVGHSGELLTWAGVFLSFVWRNFQETRATAKVTSSAGSPKETTKLVPGST